MFLTRRPSLHLNQVFSKGAANCSWTAPVLRRRARVLARRLDPLNAAKGSHSSQVSMPYCHHHSSGWGAPARVAAVLGGAHLGEGSLAEQSSRFSLRRRGTLGSPAFTILVTCPKEGRCEICSANQAWARTYRRRRRRRSRTRPHWRDPSVAGAVVLDPGRMIKGLKDSKELKPRQTGRNSRRPIRDGAIAWALGRADVGRDRSYKHPACNFGCHAGARCTPLAADVRVAYIDGNMAPEIAGCATVTVIGGDAKVPGDQRGVDRRQGRAGRGDGCRRRSVPRLRVRVPQGLCHDPGILRR